MNLYYNMNTFRSIGAVFDKTDGLRTQQSETKICGE